MNKKTITRRIMPAVAGLMVALASSVALAERPEVPCDTLDAPTRDHVESDLAMSLDDALGEDDFDTALSVAAEIMSLCTTNVYVEYTLASLYLNKKDVMNACYHFDHVLSLSDSFRKDNADIYKQLDKKYKKIKDDCAKYRQVEVSCATKGAELSISGDGVSLNHLSCPYYGYLLPGSYSVKASRQGLNSALAELVVGDEGGVLAVPELEDPNAKGHIEIKCPRGSTGFTLTDSKGKTSSYTCPYIGDVPADTYSVQLQGSEQAPTTIVVEKQGSVSHEIVSAVSTGCSATPVSNTSAPLFAGAFALLAALGLAARRRRDAE